MEPVALVEKKLASPGLEQLAVMKASADALFQGTFDPARRKFRFRFNRGANRKIDKFAHECRAKKRSRTRCVNMRNIFLPNPVSQHQRKPRLPKKNRGRWTYGLASSPLFQLLGKRWIRLPFRFDHYRVRKKLQ